jgi:hypothetical protein
MPAALERKLKREVAGKDWSKEKKDAYVYGALRKTGWKPNREKKMSSMNSLIKLNSRLDKIIQFAYDDDVRPRNKTWRSAVNTAGLATGVGAGLYGLGKIAPVSAGGQGLSPRGALRDLGKNIGGLSEASGGGANRILGNIAQGGKVAYGAGKGALASLLSKLRSLR